MAYGDNYGDGQLRPLEYKDALNKCRKWQLIVSVNGKPRKRNFPGTQGEARKALKAFKEELTSKYAVRKTVSFATYSKGWLDRREKLGVVQKTTCNKNASHVKTFCDAFGNAKMSSITRETIEELYADMVSDGAKPSYIKSMNGTLSALFKDAVIDGVAVSNIASGARRPKVQKTTRRAMPADQLMDLIDALDVSNEFETGFLLCASLGMRRGEAFGLRWECVDMDGGTVRIEAALKTNDELGSPKTDGSERTVAIPAFLVEKLRKRKAFQLDELSSAGVDADPEFVCAGVEGLGKYLAATKYWSDNRARLGADGYTIHELRHSVASMMANDMNVPPKVLMGILGHDSIETTLGIYVHSSAELERNAMSLIDGMFEGRLYTRKRTVAECGKV